jgi:hypothetical protein
MGVVFAAGRETDPAAVLEIPARKITGGIRAELAAADEVDRWSRHRSGDPQAEE